MMKHVSGASVLLDDVTKIYDAGGQPLTAVDVSLQLEPGSTTALVGASGSGKSTLLHLIGAMDTPTSGRVLIDDLDLATLRPTELAAYRRGVGFVFQRFHLLPALSIEANVTAPLLPYRATFDVRARARDLLAQVGLAGRERALPSELSGGQQQRVAIARALINMPRLLVADEPTGNLDSATSRSILELLFDLHASTGLTLVVATHDPAVADLCDQSLRIRDGRIDTHLP